MKILNPHIAIISLLLLDNCNLEPVELVEPAEKDAYRLIQENIFRFLSYDPYMWVERDSLTYDGEKLIKLMIYESEDSINFKETSKQEIEYDGDTAILTYSIMKAVDWELSNKYNYVIRNGLKLQTVGYSYNGGIWVALTKDTYQYSGKRLIVSVHYSYENGIAVEKTKVENEYNGYQKTSSHQYKKDGSGTWVETAKTENSYSGSKLISSTEYSKHTDLNWYYTHKYEYAYVNDTIYTVTDYLWDGSWLLWTKEKFYLNGSGYVIKSTLKLIIPEGMDNEKDYQYEKGKGNAGFFL
jgi:hypothetical protein